METKVMNQDLQKVIDALPHLTQAELQSVKARIGFLIKNSVPVETEISTQELMALDCIVEALSSIGVQFPQVHKLKRQSNQAFQGKVKILFDYFGCISKIESCSLLSIGLKLLIEDMKEFNIPISGGSVMRNIGRIPTLMNRAFPGYAEAGLLQMIVLRKKVK
jgi:hypothetical protein